MHKFYSIADILKQELKILIVVIFSLLVILASYFYGNIRAVLPLLSLSLGLLAGILSVLTSILLVMKYKYIHGLKTWLGVALNSGSLLGKSILAYGLILFTMMIIIVQFNLDIILTVLHFYSILAGFVAGIAIIALLAKSTGRYYTKTIFSGKHIVGKEGGKKLLDLYDAYLGATIASLLVGGAMVENKSFKDYNYYGGSVWLPIAIIAAGIIITALVGYVTNVRKIRVNMPFVREFLASFILIPFLYFFIQKLFPGKWHLFGQDFYARGLFLAAISGIYVVLIMRILAVIEYNLHVVSVYLHSRFRLPLSTHRTYFFLAMIITASTVFTGVFGIFYAYDKGGLYGLILAALAALTVNGMSLSLNLGESYQFRFRRTLAKFS